MDKSESKDEKPSEGRRFSQEQYDMLKRCSDKKDMTEWNEWRKENPTEDILLEGAFLIGAHLKSAYLTNAHLENANLSQSNLDDSDLSSARLENARFRGASLRNANLTGASLKDAELRWVNLEKVNLEGAYLQGAKFAGARFQGANLSRAILQGVLLEGASLENVTLQDANLENVLYEHGNLRRADLRRAILKGMNLWETDLSEANLIHADLEKANLVGAKLNKAALNNIHAEGANFRGANMEGAYLIRADLKGASFYNTHLEDADFLGAHLEGTNFSYAHLQRAKFTAATVDNSTVMWRCTFDRKTYLRTVRLDNIQMDTQTKQLLEYNIRRMNWEEWYPKQHRLLAWLVRKFWEISDYGISTKQIIKTFFAWALIFAAVYLAWGLIDYHLVGLKDNPGIVSNLFILEGEQETVSPWLVPFRSVYFSIVTMTTLGFGDMYANTNSFLRGLFGHALLAIQVIFGYVLLGALVTRFAVLFTAGGPAGKFADEEKKATEDTKKRIDSSLLSEMSKKKRQ